jgi:flagellar hook-associated protein 3 FlgL
MKAAIAGIARTVRRLNLKEAFSLNRQIKWIARLRKGSLRHVQPIAAQQAKVVHRAAQLRIESIRSEQRRAKVLTLSPVADSTLGSVVAQLTQAISLATQANNGTQNASDVKSISNQISGIVDEVQSLANTSYQGQYIFSGGQTSTTPFTTSNGISPEVTTYNGDADINYLVTPNGQKIQLNVPGSQIFLGAGANSVFGALNALVADYSSGTVDTAQAVSDTSALSTALNYVSQQRVTIDNSVSQVTAAGDAVTSAQTQLTSAQTTLMQADVGQVSTQLSLSETQQTALEDVIAQLDSSSNDLFTKLQ